MISAMSVLLRWYRLLRSMAGRSAVDDHADDSQESSGG
ncbi:hypothetical protein SALB1_0850 [Salinisphaera sp. LB1]|nr:hypothetical protein SALB1_0850 [Salinisphaera sp. LB1]